MDAPNDRPVDRSTADRIIQRALQLDAERVDMVSEAQLRDIAAELSVSPAALDQAIAEHHALAAPSPKAKVAWYWRAGTAASVALVLAIMWAMVIGPNL